MSDRPSFRYLAYRCVFGLGPMVPLSWCRVLGWLGGWLHWFLDTRGQRRVLDNLQPMIRHHPIRRQRWLVRRAFCRFGMACAENLHIHRLPKKLKQAPYYEVCDPWQVYGQRPLAGPAIMCTMHCNWEIFGPLLIGQNMVERVHTISLSHDDPGIDELFNKRRSAAGVESLLFQAAPLPALRALNNGAVLGLAADRDYTDHGLPVRICGRPCTMPRGPAAMAVQAGVALIPQVLARNGFTRCRAFIGKPIVPDPNGSKREQIEAMTHKLAYWYSRFLMVMPDQWVAFHRFWPDSQRREAEANNKRQTDA